MILIDGVLWRQLPAALNRSDVGAHAFGWAVDLVLGPASALHSIEVIALGVNSAGRPDGNDAVLPGAGSGRNVSGSCAAIPADCGRPGGTPAEEQCPLGAWCADVPCYWQKRSAEQLYVENEFVRAGVNTAFGGTVFGLHRADGTNATRQRWFSRNLLLEHGGAACQLSIWGYDDKGPSAWFRHPTAANPCDNTPFATESQCSGGGRRGGRYQCTARCCSQGSHVLDCTAHFPCGGWTPGAPWNPIQAQV